MTTTVQASSPEDLLALAPHLIGFHPEDSLVVLTFGGQQTPHFRVDMPHTAEWARELVAQIEQSRVMDHAPKAAMIGYTDDAAAFSHLVDSFLAAFPHTEFVVGIRTHDGHFWVGDDEGKPFDITTHPLTAQMAFEQGSAPAPSRESLRLPARASSPFARAMIDAAEDVHLTIQDAVRHGVSEDRAIAGLARAEQMWLIEYARPSTCECVPKPERFSDAELARFAVAAERIDIRDTAWSLIDADRKAEWKEFWHDAASRTCELSAPVAALFAFAAWFAGDGASSWMGVDRTKEIDPDYSMMRVLETALTTAVPPSTWEPVDVAETLVTLV